MNKSNDVLNALLALLLAFAIAVFLAVLTGYKINETQQIEGNHASQELCEYKHQAKCVNAWIKESMQNPKSKGVDNE